MENDDFGSKQMNLNTEDTRIHEQIESAYQALLENFSVDPYDMQGRDLDFKFYVIKHLRSKYKLDQEHEI